MKLSQLTEKIRIDRSMDAIHIDMKELEGRTVTVRDYDIRYDSSGKEANWIKLLLAIPGKENEGVILAREVHGKYQYLIEYLLACEKQYSKKDLLPIEDVVIENSCGYIFKGSTNQLEYFSNK